MTSTLRYKITMLALAFASSAILALPVAAAAAEPPIKEIESSRIGWEVTKAGGKVCHVASETCQLGAESGEPGGFAAPKAVAVDDDAADTAHYGHVYIADRANNRVQQLTATGAFVAMFGWDVNKTKVEAGGATTQAEKNVCTEEEIAGAGVKCQAGEEGPDVGKLAGAASIAVDPADGNVYVGELVNHRVDAYTPDGQFLWMAGGFNDPSEAAVLAAGGPEHLLYVGGEGHVQELEADGKTKREVSVGGVVTAIAVDATSGDMYVVYNDAGSVHRLNPAGAQTAEFPLNASQEGAKVEEIRALARDSAGHLAVNAREEGPSVNRWFGSLLAADGHLVTEFTGTAGGLAFGPEDELYETASFNFIAKTGQEVLAFVPKPVAELLTEPASCVVGEEHETDVRLACTLHGKLDPWGVSETEAWFQWGRTPALGEETEPQSIKNAKEPPVEGEEEPFVPASAEVAVVRPNESAFYYRLVARDHNVKAPELLTSFPIAFFPTPIVAPKTIGEPSVSFVKSSSAVMFGELNPENARTEYLFEYAPERKPGETLVERCPNGVRSEGCEGVGTTAAGEAPCPQLKPGTPPSCVYGKMGVTLEASGLQPGTPYRYRLFAEDESIAKNETTGEPEKLGSLGGEGSFTTAPAPVPQAVTGGVSSLGSTSATISGTVNPDGQPATYSFELGIYTGASTQYGVVFSGPAGASTVPVPEQLALSGLQPGTTYAYKIVIASGYGTAEGAPMAFMTVGLPSVLPPPAALPMLAVPKILFPVTVKCKRGYKLDRRGRCVKVKRKKGRKARKAVRRGKPKHGKGAHR